MWTQAEAIDLCRKIESVCQVAHCHVALTGGTLYKDGERKDCDILFYRVRQVGSIDIACLLTILRKIGLETVSDHGWCKKARYNGKSVDMFFPGDDGDYPTDHSVIEDATS